MPPEVILGLFNTFAPIVRDIIAEHHTTTGQLPTDAEIKATFAANIEKYLAEGAAWTAAHPKP